MVSWATTLLPVTRVMALLLMAATCLYPPPCNAQYSVTSPTYNPATKDWASVVSACKEAGRMEKRTMNFITRAAFHDALSVQTVNCTSCGGADASLLLNSTELIRPENVNDLFAATTAKVIRRIAMFYKISNADALAVCGMVAPSVLTAGAWDLFKAQKLKVGKLDSSVANPANQLPAADIGTADFAAFWTSRGFTIAEGVALMGSHSLLDEQGCYRGRNNNPADHCDPWLEACGDIRMFQFDNHYYVDVCTPSIATPATQDLPAADVFPEVPLTKVDENEFQSMKREEVCKFTSAEYRLQAYNLFLKERLGQVPPRPLLPRDDDVRWLNKPTACRAASVPAPMKANCPHPSTWMYTFNDAKLGQTCQAATTATASDAAIKAAMNTFAVNKTAWQAAYASAYVKMVNTGATYTTTPISITGRECASGYVSRNILLASTLTCQLQCPNPLKACPSACVCRSAFWQGIATWLSTVSYTYTRPVVPGVPAPTPSTAPEPLTIDPPIGAVPPSASLTPLPTPPPSPYATTCPTANGQSLLVDGFPASPMVLTPFLDPYKAPTVKAPTARACRTDGHCMNSYTMNITEVQVRPFDNVAPHCKVLPGTWYMAYDGVLPGPTIQVPSGTESLVRFSNKIAGTKFEIGDFPCDPKFSRPLGRPVSIHLHGSASLPPYDGWADDVTCTGESKDYIYPNNRATTLWYHDHAYGVTAPNAYSGMAGFYIVTDDSTKNSTCKQPFNLDGMEELPMMLADKVLDSQCQLLFDKAGRHHNNLYGDINTVNGVPWPYMNLQPKWYHFRFLNAGPTRPYLLRIKDSFGKEVSSSMCYIVGGDGGWKDKAAPFPATGMFLGVAERYQIVCNFASYAGQTLYVWNDRDDKIIKDVPMFCNSHLVAKIMVSPAGTARAPVVTFQPAQGLAARPLQGVFSDADLQLALSRAAAGQYDRKFVFGRRHGHWVINGETWDTVRIAAENVGQNSWELWMLKGGGGWFHPIHIHLVDFLVIQRNGANGVFTYEQLTPKDVVFLGPSQKIWVVARFGAHRGDYMFHCHNLVHEDDDMLRAFRVVGASTGLRLNQGTQFTSINTANSIIYSNWGYNNPMYGATAAKLTSLWPAVDAAYTATQVNKNLHRIFYPTPLDLLTVLKSVTTNPWKQRCPALAPVVG